MSTYRLARPLTSQNLLTEAWAGLAEDGRPVTVLRCKEPWARSPRFAESFAPYLRGWQSLGPVDAVPLVEVGHADGVICVVQEFTESEPVRAAMAGPAPPGKPPFSVQESTALVLQVARGLHALSELSPALAHGDLCASTVLISSDGAVQLEALGIAASQPADATLGPARAELVCLTPEEAAGQPAGPATDVFRLGLLWLELLTGKPAFGGSSWAEVKPRFERFPGVTAGHFPSLPSPVSTLLAMLLSKAAGDRPPVSELVHMLEQVSRALAVDFATRPLAAAFQRLFPGRAFIRPQLSGGSPLTVTPFASEGAVKLARISIRKASADDVAAAKQKENAEQARIAARDWTTRHLRDDDNPKDFALGASLIEAQLQTVAQVDAGLQHAQSFGATLFDALLALETLDEDKGLPLAAGLLKQPFLTGPQLLTLTLGAKEAAMLPRDAADDWQAFPLKLEAGGLTVAVLDPARVDVLDALKIRAKVRSVKGVRATARTIAEGFARVYNEKTTPPEWAPRPSAPEPPAPSFELDVQAEPPPPASAPRMALSASGSLESVAPASWGAPTPFAPSAAEPAFPAGAQAGWPQAGVQQQAWPSPQNAPAPFAANQQPAWPSPQNAPPAHGQFAANPQAWPSPQSAPPPAHGHFAANPQAAWPSPQNAPPAQGQFAANPQAWPSPQSAPPPAHGQFAANPQAAPSPQNAPPPAQFAATPQAAWPSPQNAPPAHGQFAATPQAAWPSPQSAPPPAHGFAATPQPDDFELNPPSLPESLPGWAAQPGAPPSEPDFPWSADATSAPSWSSPPLAPPGPPLHPTWPSVNSLQSALKPEAPRAAPPSSPQPAPPPSSPAKPPAIAPVPPAPVPITALSELPGGLDVASRLFDALLSVMGERGLEASSMIALVRSVAKQANATGAPLDQVRLSVSAVVIAALLEGKRAFEVPSLPAAAACLGPHWRDFEDFVRPLLDDAETLPSDPRGVVISLCFEVANKVGAVPKSLPQVAETLDTLRGRYPLAALAALEIVLAGS